MCIAKSVLEEQHCWYQEQCCKAITGLSWPWTANACGLSWVGVRRAEVVGSTDVEYVSA